MDLRILDALKEFGLAVLKGGGDPRYVLILPSNRAARVHDFHGSKAEFIDRDATTEKPPHA